MAFDKDLALADGSAVAAGNAASVGVVDFAAGYIMDDVFLTASGNATTAGTILVQGSVDGTTFVTVKTLTVAATGSFTVFERFHNENLYRYFKAVSGTFAGTLRLEASIGIENFEGRVNS